MTSDRQVRRETGKFALHFLHIGKTGGSAVAHALRPHTESSVCQLFLHRHPIKLHHIPRGEGVVFFLRDPISRFTSGFYSRQRQGRPRYFTAWKEEERIAYHHFSTPNQLAVALSSPNAEEKARAVAAMQSIYHLKSSYWNWFGDEQYFRSRLSDIFFVGRQERLEEDFETLKLKLKLPSAIRLPDDDILAHRNPGHLNTTIEQEGVNNLKDWYQNDYLFIELCRNVTAQSISDEGSRLSS